MSDYSWTVPGDKFWGFSYTQDEGRPIPVPDWNWSLPTPVWYWLRGGPLNVDPPSGLPLTITGSATVSYVDGSGTRQEVGSVTENRKVAVWNPYVGVKDITLGDVGVSSSSVTSGLTQEGISLVGSVGTPNLFRANGTGVWGWLQLCKLHRDYGPPSKGTKHTEYHLDSAFPYNTDSSAGDVPGSPFAAESTEDRHNYAAFGDTPEQGFFPYSSHVTVNDVFRLYIMYQPPYAGRSTTWVPLLVMFWGWNADITRSGGIFGWTAWTPTPPGAVHFFGSENLPDPPNWASRHLSGSN